MGEYLVQNVLLFNDSAATLSVRLGAGVIDPTGTVLLLPANPGGYFPLPHPARTDVHRLPATDRPRLRNQRHEVMLDNAPKVTPLPPFTTLPRRPGVASDGEPIPPRFEGIRPATRRRVELALEELDYRPNSAARALRRAKSNRIGVIAHDLEEAGPRESSKELSTKLGARATSLTSSSLTLMTSASLESGLAIAFEQRVDGILALAQSDEVVERLMTGFTGLSRSG